MATAFTHPAAYSVRGQGLVLCCLEATRILLGKVDVKICLIDETGAGDGALSVLAARWGLTQDDDNPMALVMTREHLELRKRDEPKLGGIR